MLVSQKKLSTFCVFALLSTSTSALAAVNDPRPVASAPVSNAIAASPPTSDGREISQAVEMAAPYSAQAADPQLTQAEKDISKTIKLDPVPTSQLMPIGGGTLPPIRLEASYNEPIALRDALNVALANNLPLRISHTTFESAKFTFLSSAGRFLPDYTMTFRDQKTDNVGAGDTTLRTFSNTVRFPVFQGGRIMFTALANYARMKAAKEGYLAVINDTMLEVYRRYNDVMLQRALLQIRIQAVETSRAQLLLNEQLRNAGTGTNFAVLQSRTQLALDKQALLLQQVGVRQSALNLAVSMNVNLGSNLVPMDAIVREIRLIDRSVMINELLGAAFVNRPELKQVEQSRIAARRNIQVIAGNLYPTMQFFVTATRIETGGGSGGGSRGGSSSSSSSGQQFTVQNGQVVGAGGQIVGSGSSVVGGQVTGGQAGTSTVIIPTGGGGGGGGSIGVSGSSSQNVSMGFDINWSLQGLGVPDSMNTLGARVLARQALLQMNQQLQLVNQQVRSSYLNSLTAEEQVDVAEEAVVSASEGLRLARLRLTNGVGTNLELIQAQRDYITALITQAQAIINHNIAQAQLLRDTGLISVDTLANGVPRAISWKPKK